MKPRQVSKPAAVKITILSTNDVHGQLEPIQVQSRETPARPFRIGGAEALAATLAELRAANPTGTVLLDSGDMLQGSLLSNLLEGQPMHQLYGAVGYDAVAIGNHEFDFGPAGEKPFVPGTGQDPTGALRAWIKAAPFPVLAANIREADGRPVRWTNLRPSVVLQRKGVRIGVIGLITTSTNVTTDPTHVEKLRFAPLLPVARREAATLRRAGVEVVVLLVHEGGACQGRDPGRCTGALFSELVNRLEPGEVDAVIGGHTHQCIWHQVNGIFVSEACSRGQAVGRIELVVDLQRKKVVPGASQVLPPRVVCHDVFSDSRSCEGLARTGPRKGRVIANPLLARHAPTVGKVREIVRNTRARMPSFATRVLARAARPLRNHGQGSTELGTLFTRAMLEAVPGADIALMNAGAFRASIPAGEIRYTQLYSAFPFENQLASVRLTGPQVERLLEIYHQKSDGIMQASGIKIRLRCGDGTRKITGVTDARGLPLSDRKKYLVLLSDFLLSGGDRLGSVLNAVPASDKKVYKNKKIRDVALAHIQLMRSKINSKDSPVLTSESVGIEIENGPCRVRGRRGKNICR